MEAFTLSNQRTDLNPAPLRGRRNFWPMAIVAFFAIALIGAIIFVAWAVRQKMDLVATNYYEDEILFQQQIERANRTRLLGQIVAVTYEPAQGQIAIRMPTAQALRQPTGTIHLYRPSDAHLDRRFDLALEKDGVQRLDVRGFKAGLWKIQLTWKAKGDEYFFEQPLVIGARSRVSGVQGTVPVLGKPPFALRTLWDHEPTGACVGARAPWTAAVLCRFDSLSPKAPEDRRGPKPGGSEFASVLGKDRAAL